ncbi:MAG: glycosyltransferase [Bryobacteraceae bacterium]
MIWMITGLHDPRWFQNSIENYLRQDYPEKHLVLVENGDGIGVGEYRVNFLKLGITVIRSEPGAAASLNAALSWLKANASPDDWICKCDSDDYYGPKYLDSIQEAAEAGADYAGRASLYIRTTDNQLWYVEGETDAHLFHGPTIASRLGDALDFPLVDQWGEDDLWCRAMHHAGLKPFTLAPEHFCYQRWRNYNHTWPCSDFEIRTSWLVPFRDLGPCDMDIVDGLKPRPVGSILETPNVEVNDLMATRVLMEQIDPSLKQALENGPTALAKYMQERSGQ